MATVSYEGYIRRQALHLELVQPKLNRRVVLQGVDNLSLVKNSTRAPELYEVLRKQSAEFFRGAADLRFRHGLFELS